MRLIRELRDRNEKRTNKGTPIRGSENVLEKVQQKNTLVLKKG